MSFDLASERDGISGAGLGESHWIMLGLDRTSWSERTRARTDRSDRLDELDKKVEKKFN